VIVREPISRLMPMTGQIGLRFDSTRRDIWLEALLTLADEQDELSARDMGDDQRIPPGGTPGYAVLTFRGGWEINHSLTLTAAVENVTDENYRVHGSGVNEPGINFILGVDYAF
jgi:hemoglobin/transferrin/lactoferrin receptor protein